MSDAWGPRAHPERCDEEMRCSEEAYREEHPMKKSVEESLGTALGVLVLALILAGVVVWWVR